MTRRAGHVGRTSAGQWTAAAVLLAVLPLVVAALLLMRSDGTGTSPETPAGREGSEARGASTREPREEFAEEVVMQPQYMPAATAPASTASLTALLPKPGEQSSFRITTPPTQWPSEKMYEKINGEDAVYLEAGCAGLAAMTLANPAGTETIDVYLFRMTTPQAAGTVFAAQAPDDQAADPADRPNYVALGDKAYTTYGSCYLRVGVYYLKVLVNGESKAAAEEALALARRFAANQRKQP